LNDEKISADGAAIADVVRSGMGATGSMRATERRIEGADGSYYNVQVVPVLTQRQLRRCVALVLDVSQQVRADVAREEFVSQVTHELRTPLTNIRAYAETLSSGMFDDPKVITECYNVITKETRRLSRLIEDILSISQLEVGTMQLVLDQVDLRELITECVRDVRGIAESKEIDLQMVMPPKLDPVRLDRDKIAVVINNLLGNALKYSRSGAQVVVSCKANEGEVRLSVKDTGIGIDEKDHDRIFEKFQRSDDPDVQNETGTGIGLTTAREIVRHHGGDISILSKKGEGSTFTVHLPVEKRSPASSPAAR
jgi:signal transduction histidine kinase